MLCTHNPTFANDHLFSLFPSTLYRTPQESTATTIERRTKWDEKVGYSFWHVQSDGGQIVWFANEATRFILSETLMNKHSRAFVASSAYNPRNVTHRSGPQVMWSSARLFDIEKLRSITFVLAWVSLFLYFIHYN